MKKQRSLIVIGAGGHAVSVASVAVSAGYSVRCFVDANRQGEKLLDLNIIPTLHGIYDLESVYVAIAIGDNAVREKVFNELSDEFHNLKFPVLAHNSAVLSPYSHVEQGTVIMPGAIIGPASNIGQFCIINTLSSIDHNCVMHKFSSLAPGVNVGGTVEIGIRSAISLGSVIKHRLTIGDDCVIGANSYLNKDIGNNILAYGTPAKCIRLRKAGDPYLG